MRLIPSLLLAFAFSTPARAEPPTVVTDIPPVHSLVSMVMGDLGAPTVLLDQSADPHSFQLRPAQATALQRAELIVWIGPELTPWLEDSIDALSADATSLTLLSHPLTYKREYDHDDAGEEAHLHDQHEEDDHEDDDHGEDGHDVEHDEHDHDGLDPHAWLDPENAGIWLSEIATQLAQMDPEHAADYAANAQSARATLQALDGRITAEFAGSDRLAAITLHDAYGYFLDRYGLEIAGAVRDGDAAEPGAARVAEITALIADKDIKCLLAEPQHSRALLTTLTEGSGARIDTVDPVGLKLEPGPDLYPDLMESLAQTLAGCTR